MCKGMCKGLGAVVTGGARLLGYCVGAALALWSVAWRRGKWMISGFLIGAFFGLSMGIASGGDAVNGWFLVGLFGALSGYFLSKQFAKWGGGQ